MLTKMFTLYAIIATCINVTFFVNLHLILPGSRVPGLHILPLTVRVYVQFLQISVVSSEIETHDLYSRVRNKRSRSSKVDHFRINRKRLHDFLSVSVALSLVVSLFLRYGHLLAENRQFSLPNICSTPNLRVQVSLAINDR